MSRNRWSEFIVVVRVDLSAKRDLFAQIKLGLAIATLVVGQGKNRRFKFVEPLLKSRFGKNQNENGIFISGGII